MARQACRAYDGLLSSSRSCTTSVMDRTELPIFEIEADIVSNVGKSGRLVVQAPTGSGKSTQIPQMILDHGLAGQGQIDRKSVV